MHVLRSRRHIWVIGIIAAIASCAHNPKSKDALLGQLRRAMATPVRSKEDTQKHNNLVQNVVDEAALHGKWREEVAKLIGRGTECKTYKLCADRGYEWDDWYYEVGTHANLNSARVPLLIVGFDNTGRVAHTGYVRME